MKKYKLTEHGRKLIPSEQNTIETRENWEYHSSIMVDQAIVMGILEEHKEPELFGWDEKNLYKISGEDWTHKEHQLLVNAYNGEFKKIPLAIEWAHGVFRKWHTDDNDLTFADLLIK